MAKTKSREERLEQARRRGYDSSKLIEPLEPACARPTKKKRESNMRIWEEFLEVHKLSEPSLADVTLFQRFVLYYSYSRDGRLEQWLTVGSVVNFWITFAVAYRLQRKPLSKEIMTEVTRYIKEGMPNLSQRLMAKPIVTGADIEVLFRQLWQRDPLGYLHERTRVQLALWLCLEESSGQRGGTYCESSSYPGSDESLWYKDIELQLIRSQATGQLEFLLLVGIRFRKNERKHTAQPGELVKSPLYEQVYPLRNGVMYFLALALADGAIKGYRTVSDLLKANIRPGETNWTFQWTEGMQDKPVLRMVNSKGPTGKSLTYSSMHTSLVELGRRAGYKGTITAHGIRRAFLNVVNETCTTAELNQMAGHRGDEKTFEKSYQATLTKIDGQSLMNKQEMRTDHVQFRGMLASRRPDLPQALPDQYKAKFVATDQEFIELGKKLQSIKEDLLKQPDDPALKAQRQYVYKERSALVKKALKKYQEEYDIDRYDEEVAKQLLSDPEKEIEPPEGYFSILRQFLPERDRLSASLFEMTTLRSSQGQEVIEDLLSLSRRSCSMLFRPGEEPVDGRCPFNGCGKSVDNMKAGARNHHLHACHRNQLRGRGAPKEKHYKNGKELLLYSFTQFCFHCNEWILSREQWKQDREKHVQEATMFCGVYTYRNLLLRPGLCPFCMGDEKMEPQWRFQHWCRKDEQLRHLETHFVDVPIDGEATCQHPKCRSVHPGRDALRRHFEAVHYITKPKTNGSINKRALDDGATVAGEGEGMEAEEDLKTETNVDVDDQEDMEVFYEEAEEKVTKRTRTA